MFEIFISLSVCLLAIAVVMLCLVCKSIVNQIYDIKCNAKYLKNKVEYYPENVFYLLINLTDEIAKNSEKISASDYNKIRDKLIKTCTFM